MARKEANAEELAELIGQRPLARDGSNADKYVEYLDNIHSKPRPRAGSSFSEAPYWISTSLEGQGQIEQYAWTGSTDLKTKIPLIPDLHMAAKHSDVKKMKNLVKNGNDVNEKDGTPWGWTPMHFAARYRNMHGIATEGEEQCMGEEGTMENISAIKYLASVHAKVNAQDAVKRTPLHYAIQCGSKSSVKDLLECTGIDTKAKGQHGLTPLQLACTKSDTEIVQLLLPDDGEVPKVPRNLYTELNEALVRAVQYNQLEVTKLCIEKGANVNFTFSSQRTPLHFATELGNHQLVQFLIEQKANVNAQNKFKDTPLIIAAKLNYEICVKELLNNSAKVDAKGKFGLSPLMIAAQNGHTNIVKKLLSCGAEIGLANEKGVTALLLAAMMNREEVLGVLLAHDESSNNKLLSQCDVLENLPLHMSAENGHFNCTKMLLDKGSDIDARNESGDYPVLLAAKNGHTECVQLLLRRNYWVKYHKNLYWETGLHLATKGKHIDVANAFLDAGMDKRTMNSTDHQGYTSLAVAAENGATEICHLLLKNEVSPNTKIKEKEMTPLHLACMNGNLGVVELLIQNSDVKIQKDSDGNNCLDIAIDQGFIDISKAILNSEKWEQALGNCTVQDGYATTPMKKMIQNYPDLASLALDHCKKTKKLATDKDYEVTYNYRFLQEHLDGQQEISKDIQQDHPLMLMLKHNPQLLLHDVVQALRMQKWKDFWALRMIASMVLYTIFLCSMTAYIWNIKAPYMQYSHLTGNSSVQTGCHTDVEEPYRILRYCIALMALIFLVEEGFQLKQTMVDYLCWSNVIQLALFTSSILFVVDFDICQWRTGIRTNWQWHLGAVSVFLGWIALLVLVRLLPYIGVYVVMLSNIFGTFLLSVPMFSILLVAFSCTFYALLQNQDEFGSPAHSLMKSVVMMTGEFDYENMFMADDKDISMHVPYRTHTRIMFMAFAVIMTVVYMNLLIGLTIDDIKNLRAQSNLAHLAMQTELSMRPITWLKKLFPRYYEEKYCRTEEVKKPNVHWYISNNKHLRTVSRAFVKMVRNFRIGQTLRAEGR